MCACECVRIIRACMGASVCVRGVCMRAAVFVLTLGGVTGGQMTEATTGVWPLSLSLHTLTVRAPHSLPLCAGTAAQQQMTSGYPDAAASYQRSSYPAASTDGFGQPQQTSAYDYSYQQQQQYSTNAQAGERRRLLLSGVVLGRLLMCSLYTRRVLLSLRLWSWWE